MKEQLLKRYVKNLLSDEDVFDMSTHAEYVVSAAKEALKNHRAIMNLSWGALAAALKDYDFYQGYRACRLVWQHGWDFSEETKELRNYVEIIAAVAAIKDKCLEDYL